MITACHATAVPAVLIIQRNHETLTTRAGLWDWRELHILTILSLLTLFYHFSQTLQQRKGRGMQASTRLGSMSTWLILSLAGPFVPASRLMLLVVCLLPVCFALLTPAQQRCPLATPTTHRLTFSSEPSFNSPRSACESVSGFCRTLVG